MKEDGLEFANELEYIGIWGVGWGPSPANSPMSLEYIGIWWGNFRQKKVTTAEVVEI